MARTKQDPLIGSRTSRRDLKQRKEPYWMVLERGRALGYYRGINGGSWVARFYDPQAVPSRRFHPLGAADDVSDPDGKMVLSFAQAQDAAREWFKEAFHQATGGRVTSGEYLVSDAVRDYLDDRTRNGTKTAVRMGWDFRARVLPVLGNVPAAKLTQRRLEIWLAHLAASPARRRGEGDVSAPVTADELRARKSTANRIWKMLQAALNLAVREHRIPSDAGWRDVKPFKGTHHARLRFLDLNEQVRLVNAATPEDFRSLVQAALFTGARAGELLRLQVQDLDVQGMTIFLEFTKTGRGRHVHLTPEALAFFKERTSGQAPGARIFPRTHYDRPRKDPAGTWSRAELSRMMAATCRAASLDPLVFHELRHTYASGLVNAGMALVFVAQQLGHRDIRMVQEHYGHLCPTAKGEAIRTLSPVLGIHTPSGVSALQVKNA